MHHNQNFGVEFKIKIFCPIAIRSCGGLLSGYSGIITSPKHPEKNDEYVSDTVCEWTIQLPLGEKVSLHFDSFDLEDSDNCTYDNVEVMFDLLKYDLLLQNYQTNVLIS